MELVSSFATDSVMLGKVFIYSLSSFALASAEQV